MILRRSAYFLVALLYEFKENLKVITDPRPELIPLTLDFPGGLGIEVTNICNSNCIFCGYQYRMRPAALMSQATFERVIKQYVGLGGGGLGLTPVVGDPLIDRNLVAKIAYARSFSQITDIHLTTNAILLVRKRFEELVDAGLTMMTISMSGFDPAEYKRVYRNPGYGAVMSNLYAIAGSDRFSKVRVEIGIRTDSIFPWLRVDYWQLRTLGFKISRNCFFDTWSGRIREENLGRFMFLRPHQLSKRIPCVMLYRGPQVLADGKITACGCRDLEGTSELSLGHVSDVTIDAAWKNGMMEKLRERFVKDDLPDVCRDCTHYTPVSRVDHLIYK